MTDLENIKPEEFTKTLNMLLLAYINETEVPILSEFCALLNLWEEYIFDLADKSNIINATIKVLENKKRSALERKIYTGELNATIGGNLLKSWREAEKIQEDEF